MKIVYVIFAALANEKLSLIFAHKSVSSFKRMVEIITNDFLKHIFNEVQWGYLIIFLSYFYSSRHKDRIVGQTHSHHKTPV